tara:strand:- start:1518 stop:2102 length:585 start_codon:yes stop_codon:yes gene_type:complete
MFSNKHKKITSYSQSNKNVVFSFNNLKSNNSKIQASDNNTSNESNKMIWGKPTWYFLHTLAEKVKDEHFAAIKGELLGIIYQICCNLPCPLCANHAKKYLDNINFGTINTKNDLIKMLYLFHNEVNARKNYELFNYNEVEKLYSKAKFVNMANNFFYHYNNYINLKLQSDSLHRKQVVKKVKLWLNNNINHFNM